MRRLIRASWEIDAHTITHADLTALEGEALEREVAGSRRAIRRAFGVPVDFFCYPSGRYDVSADHCRSKGRLPRSDDDQFGLARASEPFTLDRVRVNGSDGMDGFAAKLDALVP